MPISVHSVHTIDMQGNSGEALNQVDSAQELFQLQEQALVMQHRTAELEQQLQEAKAAEASLAAALKSERTDKDRCDPAVWHARECSMPCQL